MKINSFKTASSFITPEKVPHTPENPPDIPENPPNRTGGRFSPTENQQKIVLSMQRVHHVLFHGKVEFSSLETLVYLLRQFLTLKDSSRNKCLTYPIEY